MSLGWRVNQDSQREYLELAIKAWDEAISRETDAEWRDENVVAERGVPAPS